MPNNLSNNALLLQLAHSLSQRDHLGNRRITLSWNYLINCKVRRELYRLTKWVWWDREAVYRRRVRMWRRKMKQFVHAHLLTTVLFLLVPLRQLHSKRTFQNTNHLNVDSSSDSDTNIYQRWFLRLTGPLQPQVKRVQANSSCSLHDSSRFTLRYPSLTDITATTKFKPNFLLAMMIPSLGSQCIRLVI